MSQKARILVSSHTAIQISLQSCFTIIQNILAHHSYPLGCIGPESEQAGKASGCAGCPNQKICASGEARQPDPGNYCVGNHDMIISSIIILMQRKMRRLHSHVSTHIAIAVVQDKLSSVKHKIVVLSGKGGVGKTTFACQLSFALAQQGLQVCLLYSIVYLSCRSGLTDTH